jgi:transcriptional regulator with XRE-family HTH domain
MKTSVHKRFEDMIKTLGITRNAFATRVGVASTQVYNIVNGRNAPSHDMYERIGIEIPEINLTWLITGKGLAAAREDHAYSQAEIMERLKIMEAKLEQMEHKRNQ